MAFKRFQSLIVLMVLFGIFFAIQANQPVQATEAPPAGPQGVDSWVDTIQIHEIFSEQDVVDQLSDGSLDFYTYKIQDPAWTF